MDPAILFASQWLQRNLDQIPGQSSHTSSFVLNPSLLKVVTQALFCLFLRYDDAHICTWHLRKLKKIFHVPCIPALSSWMPRIYQKPPKQCFLQSVCKTVILCYSLFLLQVVTAHLKVAAVIFFFFREKGAV